MSETLMGVKQLMHRLGVCDETIYRLCNSGQLAHSRVGKMIRVSEAQLQAYLHRNQTDFPAFERRTPAAPRTQRITRNAEPNWDSPICQPRTRKKAV